MRDNAIVDLDDCVLRNNRHDVFSSPNRKGNLLPSKQRQHYTCLPALCYILHPVLAALTSLSQKDSIPTCLNTPCLKEAAGVQLT